MAAADELIKLGWTIDKSKLEYVIEKNFDENISKDKLANLLLDIDIKDYGQPTLANCLNKKLAELLAIPLVLQLTKWRNISKPKINEHIGNDGICKLTLSDGFSAVECLQIDNPININGDTPYGSKVLLSNSVSYESGYLILTPKNCKLLGGHVEKLVEKWKISMMTGVKLSKNNANYPKFEPFENLNLINNKAKDICKQMNNLKIDTRKTNNKLSVNFEAKNRQQPLENASSTKKFNKKDSKQQKQTTNKSFTSKQQQQQQLEPKMDDFKGNFNNQQMPQQQRQQNSQQLNNSTTTRNFMNQLNPATHNEFGGGGVDDDNGGVRASNPSLNKQNSKILNNEENYLLRTGYNKKNYRRGSESGGGYSGNRGGYSENRDGYSGNRNGYSGNRGGYSGNRDRSGGGYPRNRGRAGDGYSENRGGYSERGIYSNSNDSMIGFQQNNEYSPLSSNSVSNSFVISSQQPQQLNPNPGFYTQPLNMQFNLPPPTISSQLVPPGFDAVYQTIPLNMSINNGNEASKNIPPRKFYNSKRQF